MKRWLYSALIPLMVLLATHSEAQSSYEFLSVDRFVPHHSTVVANNGDAIGLYLHEKISTDTAARLEAGGDIDGRVVLFIHGVSVPSVPAFDLAYKDYSWMEFLASAGFDTFSLDQQGYGYSPQPHMNNPCNLSADDRELLNPAVKAIECEPDYQAQLTSSLSDWDEIDSAVDYIRELRGVESISLIGWSLGGMRAGGYAAAHPQKLDQMVLFAPFFQADSADKPPTDFPQAGPVMTFQTKDTLMNNRWASNLACEDQLDEGIADRVWQTIMGFDRYGSTWVSPSGVMRVRTASYWAWNAATAGMIKTPTLIMVGRQDGLLPGAEALFGEMTGLQNKVLVRMECATHFALWERSQYHFMHQASLEWLQSNRFRGQQQGEFSAP